MALPDFVEGYGGDVIDTATGNTVATVNIHGLNLSDAARVMEALLRGLNCLQASAPTEPRPGN